MSSVDIDTTDTFKLDSDIVCHMIISDSVITRYCLQRNSDIDRT